MSITQAVTPLRMIFWGGLLCVFDITFRSTTAQNGQSPTGFRFDLLNDFVGMLLITFGIAKLRAFELDQSFRTGLKFVFICAVLNCVAAFLEHVIFDLLILDILFAILGLASLGAVIMFCTCMHRLSVTFSLTRSGASWLTTRLLVIVLWVIPLGLFYVVGLGALLTGNSFHLDLGIFGIPFLFVFVAPLVHLFVSTSRMKSEAELPITRHAE